MTDDPSALSVAQLAKAYRQKELRPTDVVEHFLDKINEGPVYRLVTQDRARQQARRAEKWFEAGVELGPLQGVPVALKDLIDTEGNVSAAGSKVLASRAPAEDDAPVAARLDAAGAVFLGKTNMTELAFSGLGINPHFGTPSCALNKSRIPGGSSSGSAVAVAKGWASAAIGSDTGGSVRIPASINGIVGLKTTNGLIPKDKVTPLSTTLDTLGPMTKTLEDAWLVFLALAAKPYQPFKAACPDKVQFLVPTNVLTDEADDEVIKSFEQACEALERAGHHLSYQAVPEFDNMSELYRRYGHFASHESLALYEDMLLNQGDEVDPRVAKRILEFKGGLSTDYLRLSYIREQMVRDFWQDYRAFDAVLCPTLPILPPTITSLSTDEAYFNANRLCLSITRIFNYFSGPAVSVPYTEVDNGLSVGIMVATAPHTENLALSLATLVVEPS